MSNSSVQEVRDRIIQLAREIEEFSRSDSPPQSFFQEFLKRVVGAVGARAGAVWMRNSSNQLELVSEVGLATTGFHENPNALSANQKLLVEVISNGQACTYHPSGSNVPLPTEDMLVLAALQQNKEVVGVVEIFQRHDTPEQARPGFLQFVEQMTGYACRYLDKQTQTSSASQTGMVGKVAEEFEQFVLQLHNSLDPRDVAFTAANDGRLLIGCDRMSVVILDGKKAVVRGVSGQEKVNQRANLIRRMTKLAQRVIRSKETLLYTGKVDHLAPKVEKALADFVQESGSRMVTVIPVFEPDPLVEKEEDRARPKEKIRRPVGGLIIEQIAESQPKPGVIEKSELISDHIGSAIFNAKRYNRLFLMPVWRGLGKCYSFLEGKNGIKAALILLLIAAAITAMVFVPYEYRVEGQGRLLPVTEADVFAPWDGEVSEIKVKSGARVAADQVLLIIENKDLDQQWQAALGELETKETLRQKLAAMHGRLTGPDDQSQRLEIQGQWMETGKQLESLTEQLRILKERRDKLVIKAPIAGVVATFQLDQLLKNRPVRRGELLLEIKDDQGDWKLELEIEEHRSGHILDAQRRLEKQDLRVEFVLATDSEKTVEGTLGAIDTRTNSSQELGGVIVAFATFKKSELPRTPRIGAEVRAKISCGEKSLGYVLFGDVVEFVQKYFWL
ncbi:MAG: HlyD family efflux transporter periplasmic adaptor subunit [Planctomycetota bacterium]|nr:HlyD family efflux transporter periplasmic adaptor subunit [Planctomycetota bacterium]MDA1247774.1 HlyD family efflux transporter periplasmic adaptor subunit [Planctomycetota bacterium]